MDPELIARFWERVDKSGECWTWTGAKLPAGYGTFSVRGKNQYAHRLSVILDGRDPTGMVVMHRCDNPPCVRPDHLVIGTQADNRRDCAAKGRNPLNGNQNKTHCKRGHDLKETGRRTGHGNQRVCTVCAQLCQNIRRRALRAARHSEAATWLP